MFCNRCGNRLTPESLFCNRCGSKVQSQSPTTPPRAKHLASPPPRPARRAPVIPAIPDQGSLGEYEEDYPERYEYEDDYREGVPGLDEEIFSVNPTIFEVVPGYLLAIALSLIATAVVALVDGNFLIAVIGASVFFIMPIIRHIRLKHTVYTLTPTKVEIRTGILSKSTQSIPLHHIDNVEVSETLKERMIGIGDVLIDSAALDSKMVMNNIRNPREYADMIMYQLRNKR